MSVFPLAAACLLISACSGSGSDTAATAPALGAANALSGLWQKQNALQPTYLEVNADGAFQYIDQSTTGGASQNCYTVENLNLEHQMADLYTLVTTTYSVVRRPADSGFTNSQETLVFTQVSDDTQTINYIAAGVDVVVANFNICS